MRQPSQQKTKQTCTQKNQFRDKSSDSRSNKGSEVGLSAKEKAPDPGNLVLKSISSGEITPNSTSLAPTNAELAQFHRKRAKATQLRADAKWQEAKASGLKAEAIEDELRAQPLINSDCGPPKVYENHHPVQTRKRHVDGTSRKATPVTKQNTQHKNIIKQLEVILPQMIEDDLDDPTENITFLENVSGEVYKMDGKSHYTPDYLRPFIRKVAPKYYAEKFPSYGRGPKKGVPKKK